MATHTDIHDRWTAFLAAIDDLSDTDPESAYSTVLNIIEDLHRVRSDLWYLAQAVQEHQ